MNNKIKFLTILGIVSLILSACTAPMNMDSMGHDMGNGQKDRPAIALEGKQPSTATEKGGLIELTAREGSLKTKDGKKWPIWGYNGTAPGPTIRVKEGETVRVKLTNKLPEPVTIHWHGLPVPNRMDGVAGITQDAVEPGKSFTYEFKADVPPGTYWYHSHQKSAEQVDKGLYGTVIVEPKGKPDYDRDYTLVLDEWMEPGKADGESSQGDNKGSGKDQGRDMGGMDHGSGHKMNMDGGKMDMGGMNHMDKYTIYTINGGTYPDIEPLKVKKGDRVKLRLVNAGFMTHKIHVHGSDIRVTNMDGMPINRPEPFKDKLIPVAPGERYEVEFTADQPGNWLIECHGNGPGAKGMKVAVQYEDTSGTKDRPGEMEELPVLDMTRYGQPKKAEFTSDDSYDRVFTAELNEAMDHAKMEEIFTINGKTMEEAKPFKVKMGDRVKIRFVNKGKQDHPMHLHGHHFQVLTKNGKPLQGAPIWKDTINVRPGESYEIAFVADNPGDWMLHCHDLHHAAGGMATQIKYDGYKSFKPDPDVENIPE